MYTVELYKLDKRTKEGERLVRKVDHSTTDQAAIAAVYNEKFPAAKGYRFELRETYITRKSLVDNKEFKERYDTPYYCSPRSESYWSS
jgi:hypothetical protein